MYRDDYGKFDDFKKQVLNKRVVEWDKDKLVLDDGTIITIECSESDCCAYADGEFKDVELDAMITNIQKQEVYNRISMGDDFSGENHSKTIVTLFHNQNVAAIADVSANDGNGGYYYSVGSLVVKGIHYPVVDC